MISIDTETVTADLQALLDDLDAATSAEAANILVELSARGRDTLRELDEKADHNALATMWTYEVAPTEDGAEGEVFSGAESVTFFNRTSDQGSGRVKSSLYPIEGTRLLAILEGGAGEHDIFPGTVNTGAKALTIPIPGSEDRGKEFLRKYGPSPMDPGDTQLRGSVHHPGVAPEHHIADTTDQILLTLDAQAELVAQRIADRF